MADIATYRSMSKTELAEKAKSGEAAKEGIRSKRQQAAEMLDEGIGVLLGSYGLGYAIAKGTIPAKINGKWDTELIVALAGAAAAFKGRGRVKRIGRGLMFGAGAGLLRDKGQAAAKAA